MLSKKVDRVLRICAEMRDLWPEVEAEMCDSGDLLEDRYARHYLFSLACSEVSTYAGVLRETVFRQMVKGFGISEDDLTDIILDFLVTVRDEPEKRQNTRFVKLLYESLSLGDSLNELAQRINNI